MRLRLQPTLVIQAASASLHRIIRVLIALWRATLLSATTYFVLTGTWSLIAQGSPLAPFGRFLFKLAVGFEWLPFQVGKIIPVLRIPNEIGALCGFEGRAIPSMVLPPGGWMEPAHLILGNYYLEWDTFLRHMQTGVLVYFLIFVALSEIRHQLQERNRRRAIASET